MDYKFTFTQQEVMILMAGLGELPLKHSANLANKIARSQQEQDNRGAMSIDELMATVDQRPDPLMGDKIS